MNEQEMDQHLSHISTMWTVLQQAHRGAGDEMAAARKLLMQRYLGAVYRYLYSAVRDANVAADLSQEFALRFLQGRFAQAERGQGRFRNYVKTALFHLVNDYRRNQLRGIKAVPLAAEDLVPAPDEQAAAEQAFRDSWRLELLAKAWKGLEQVQKQTGQPYHEVLRLRVDHPQMKSEQIAEELGARVGRSFTAAHVRQLLRRARDRFGLILLDEVRESLGPEGAGDLEEELAELNLLKYCQDLLKKPEE
jgi:RNA polymerase sigma factor (sigma-70 family)